MNEPCVAILDVSSTLSNPSEAPDPDSVRRQLEALRWSRTFHRCARLMQFLGHVVEAKLDGKPRLLTETAIGKALYAVGQEYDARIDSTVRVEARRLRRKLDEYYAIDGAGDDVIIQLPVGSYSPQFFGRQGARALAVRPAAQASEAPQPIFVGGPGAAIVVLPLLVSADPADTREFAENLGDELRFGLSRSPGLRVVSRGAMEQALTKNLSVPVVAAELGVDAVVQGAVCRIGSNMRVTLDVSDARGFVVWSDRIDLPDGERQRLIELFVATMLSRLRLDSSRMRARRIGPGPDALQALGTIYSARQLLDQQTPASLLESRDRFQQVAASAPDYARGHSGIADCHCDMYRLGMLTQSEARSAARAAAVRAIEIDPDSVEAHGALATVCGWLEWNRFEAEERFKAALRLGESSRTARAYGVLLTLMGRHEEAEQMLWEARQMEPFSTQQDIAETICHFQSRRFGDGVRTLEAVPASRLSSEALFYVALSNIMLEETAGARDALASIHQGLSKHPQLVYAREELAAWLGDPQAARALLLDDAPGATAFGRATLAMAARDETRALGFLRAAITRRELSAVWIRSDPRFDRLRGSAQFAAVVAELNRVSIDRFGDPKH